MSKYNGLGVALVTPFKSDFSVDFEALERLINYQIDNSVDFLVILGSTGEAATLSLEERKEILEKSLVFAKGRIPMVAGASSNNTRAILSEIKSNIYEGYDALMTVCPWYNKPSQSGIYEHFNLISKAWQNDIILYNVPGRTSSNLEVNTVLKLIENNANIVALKEASGNVGQVDNFLNNLPEYFDILSGDDPLTLPLMSIGAKGLISVIGQAFPSQIGEMVRFCTKNEFSKARNIHFALKHITDLAFKEGNPTGIKSILNTLELCEDFVRLPLMCASTQLKNEIKIEIEENNLLH